MAAGLTPQEFVRRWAGTTLTERASYQFHFADLCHLVGHDTPDGSGMDRDGLVFVSEHGLKKSSGGQGFADVFYENHFAIEYKGAGKYNDLSEALNQIKQYRENLKNPPLLIVTDIATWEIHTNFTNAANKSYTFSHEQITQPHILRWLRNIFFDPNQLHPNRTAEQVTAEAANVFKRIADHMRGWEADPERIAHFMTKLVFCLFAEDTGLLPVGPSGDGVFTEVISQTRSHPDMFTRYMHDLFESMAKGGHFQYKDIPYFNGALFDDITVERLESDALGELETASRLDWGRIEPAIFGTLFERSLDPAKRAQLGAHYTSRDDIMLIVEPVLMGPLRREWDEIRAEAEAIRARYDAADNRRSQTIYRDQLNALREGILNRVGGIRVLDPACGSGNFLYVSLGLLLDLEKEIITDPVWADVGLTMPLRRVHPRQLYGIEVNVIAHALSSIVVWIGYIQWMRDNGYDDRREPILEDLHGNIQLMDAIMEVTPSPGIETPSPGPFPEVSGKGSSTERESGERTIMNRDSDDSPPQRLGEGLGVGSEAPGVGSGWTHTHTPKELYGKLMTAAREMRKEPTPAEDALWQRIRKRQLHDVKFRRQHTIDRFIVDFYASDAALVIEVDGPVHDEQAEYDDMRQAYLESLGLRVLRFTNAEVLQQMEAVLEVIGEVLLTPGQETPPPAPPQSVGEGSRVREPDWPEVDVIVGNPPFLGRAKLRGELGEFYVDQLFQMWEGRVPHEADLVVYWLEKARSAIEQGKANRVGLLATQSIRTGANRKVLDRIKSSGDVFMAWSDREWILDGASVRVSMVGFDNGSEITKMLDGQEVNKINADLTSSVDLTQSIQLTENIGIAFQGINKVGKFDIDYPDC